MSNKSKNNTGKSSKKNKVADAGSDNALTFKFIEGFRRGSQLVYVPSEKQIYKFKSKYDKNKLYVCYAKNCRVHIKLVSSESSHCWKTRNIPHNHRDQEELVNKMRLTNSIKARCEKLTSKECTVREAFEEECSKSGSTVNLVEFNKMRRQSKKIRDKSLHEYAIKLDVSKNISDDLPFVFVEGLRRGSKLLHIPSEKQLYKFKYKNANYKLYMCYTKKCPVYIKVDLNNDKYCRKTKKTPHNHPKQEDIVNKMQLISSIKARCENLGLEEGGSIRKVFLEECSKSGFAHLVEFSRVRRQLLKIKNENKCHNAAQHNLNETILPFICSDDDFNKVNANLNETNDDVGKTDDNLCETSIFHNSDFSATSENDNSSKASSLNEIQISTSGFLFVSCGNDVYNTSTSGNWYKIRGKLNEAQCADNSLSGANTGGPFIETVGDLSRIDNLNSNKINDSLNDTDDNDNVSDSSSGAHLISGRTKNNSIEADAKCDNVTLPLLVCLEENLIEINRIDKNTIPFEYVEGLRRGSKLVYVPSEKQLYKFKSKYNTNKLYVCYTKNCHVNVVINSNIENYCRKTKENSHNHRDQEELVNKMRLTNSIKARCEKLSLERGNIRKAFMEECSKSEDFAHLVEFSKMRRHLITLKMKNAAKK